jgi:Asp-tRNA(Asn)/Glu-tRNA(Gln) amidotransferase A subunit family amidase
MAETQQQAASMNVPTEATTLPERSFREVVDLMRAGQLSARQYASALIERLKAVEPRIHAFALFDERRVLESADAADRAPQGTNRPLTGIPVAIKDIINTAGVPTQMGSPIFANWVPDKSAKIVRDIEAQGGYVFGKAHTSEFAFRTPAATRNPWNLAHTPGGSSGGSAAAVAARLAPLAVGTQTNGSVIRPAAYCGVVGFKPTYYLLSCDGVFQMSPTLDQIGIMARSVDDVASFLGILTRERVESGQAKPERLADIRLLALKSPVWEKAEQQQKESFSADVERLRKSGAHIEWQELDEQFNDAHRSQRTIVLYEAANKAYRFSDAERQKLSDGLRAFLVEGAAVPQARYEEALATRSELQKVFEDYVANFDAVVTPAVPGPAPKGLQSTGDPTFSTIWTLLGVPAMTIPTGLTSDGLPLAIQIVAGVGNDHELLGVASLSEEVFQFSAAPRC